MAAEGSWKAYFRGNGANVVKNVPETAIKLGLNDRIKALVVKDGHSITVGAAQPSLRPAGRAATPARLALKPNSKKKNSVSDLGLRA